MSDTTTTTPAAETPAAPPTDAAPTASAPVVAPPVAAPAPPAPVAAAKPAAAAAPAHSEPADKGDAVIVALRAVQADNASLVADLKSERAARAKAERERDAHAATVDELGKRAAEGAIVGRLRDLVPAGVPEIDLRGALGALHEQGKVNRYSADSEAAAEAAVDALKAANSSIFRVAPPPGGPAGAPQQPVAPARHKAPFG